jgi:hypothetical protein
LNKQVNETGQYNYKRCQNWAVRFNTKSWYACQNMPMNVL